MNRKYRKELKKLDKIPDETIYGIYIIPDKAYNGFWGRNGFKSYDFIFEGKKGQGVKKLGWMHWEGDVISLYNNKLYGMEIDTQTGEDYIRLFNNYGFDLSDFELSHGTIKTREKKDE